MMIHQGFGKRGPGIARSRFWPPMSLADTGCRSSGWADKEAGGPGGLRRRRRTTADMRPPANSSGDMVGDRHLGGCFAAPVDTSAARIAQDAERPESSTEKIVAEDLRVVLRLVGEGKAFELQMWATR
jgi:hypothetical protein